MNQFVVSGGSRPDGKFAAEPMPPKRIDQLRALRHQHFARPVMHKRSLVLGRRTVSAFIATAFAQDAAAAAKARRRKVAAQLRATLPNSRGRDHFLVGQCRKLRWSSRSSYTRPKGTIAFELRQSCQPSFDERCQLTIARPLAGSSTCRRLRSRPWLTSTSSGVRVGTSGKTGRPPGNRTSGARDR